MRSIGTQVVMGVFICFCPFSPWQGENWVCLACRVSMPLCACTLWRETLCWTAVLAALLVNQVVWKGRWLYCFSVTPLDLKLEIKVSLHSRSNPGQEEGDAHLMAEERITVSSWLILDIAITLVLSVMMYKSRTCPTGSCIYENVTEMSLIPNVFWSVCYKSS